MDHHMSIMIDDGVCGGGGDDVDDCSYFPFPLDHIKLTSVVFVHRHLFHLSRAFPNASIT
jgi:hypothetical protein